MMRCARAIALAFCVLLGLALPGWNSRQIDSSQRTIPPAVDSSATDLQIQSSVLRIEFDRNLHSRIVARLDPSPKPMTPFSASETVTGVGRTWTDFALTSSHRGTVTDAFGAGERLSLTGQSGDLRKSISVTIYADFPSSRHL